MGRRARQGGVVPANFRQRKRLPALSIVGAGFKPARRLPHLRRNFIPEHPVGKGGFETRPYTKKRPFPEQKLLGAFSSYTVRFMQAALFLPAAPAA